MLLFSRLLAEVVQGFPLLSSLSNYNFIYLFCLHVCMHVGACAMMCEWSPEHNSCDSVLSLHHVGSEDQTHIVRLSGKHSCSLSHIPQALHCHHRHHHQF